MAENGKGEPDEDLGDSDAWACWCGHYEESGLHCSNCGNEPPWGCPGECCQDGFDDEDCDGDYWDTQYLDEDFLP